MILIENKTINFRSNLYMYKLRSFIKLLYFNYCAKKVGVLFGFFFGGGGTSVMKGTLYNYSN